VGQVKNEDVGMGGDLQRPTQMRAGKTTNVKSEGGLSMLEQMDKQEASKFVNMGAAMEMAGHGPAPDRRGG